MAAGAGIGALGCLNLRLIDVKRWRELWEDVFPWFWLPIAFALAWRHNVLAMAWCGVFLYELFHKAYVVVKRFMKGGGPI